MAPYKIKNVETVVKGTDVLVRVFTLAPGETIPRHFVGPPRVAPENPLPAPATQW
jgi:hypothetical protein